jgi:xylulose-5-phosphate/fructose-6-phosphate phosphoketolase
MERQRFWRIYLLKGRLMITTKIILVMARGWGNLIKDFSWPYKFPSHVTPDVPGSILEGGELGYSLATAFGAAMDNPDLLVTVVIGDGEAESGPLAASWNGNKFLNPCESGSGFADFA